MTAPVGILPFDSADPSIILKCSLKSAAAVAAPDVGPAGTITGTAHTFDPDQGFRPASSGNSGIAFASPTGFADLDHAGQVSFEVTRAIACALATSTQSVGTNPGGVQWSLVWGNGSNTGSIRKVGGTPSSFQLRTHNSSDTAGILYIHSDGKGDFARITYSWIGSRIMLFVDGKPVATWSTTPTRNTRWSNQWQNINLMSAASGVNPERDGFMRNFILSTKPVVLPVHATKRVAFLGHSFAVTYANQSTVNVDNYESNIATELRRLANLRGYDLDCSAFGVAGGFWDPALTANDIRDHVVTAMRSLPSVLVCFGPTNDVANGSFVAATVDAAIKADLGTIAAHSAMPGLRQILFCTTPSRAGITSDGTWNDTIRANIEASNALIRVLPAWWNTNFPAYSGRLKVCDLFNTWGGMYPSRAVMVGQRSGAFTNLHPSVLGQQDIARAIFDTADF